MSSHDKHDKHDKKDEKKSEPTGLIVSRKVSFEKKYDEGVVLKEFEGIDVDGAVFIEGFPSLALTGVLTVGYLSEKMNLPLVGDISSTKFPPKCVIEGSQPMNSIRLRGNKDIVVVHCEFKLPTPELTNAVSKVIVDFVQRHKCKTLFTIEGMPVDSHIDTFEKIRFLSSDPEFVKFAIAQHHLPIGDGVIAGITGLLLAESLYSSGSHSYSTTALLAPSLANFPDARSAVHVIKLLAEYCKLKVDTSELETKAAALEIGVTKLVQQEEQQKNRALGMYL